MIDWLPTHLAIVSVLVSVGSLLVWVFYARLLWIGFNRGERPLILIHQAGGMGPGSSCLVVNLSRQPLHVINVHFILHTENHAFDLRVNEYRRITNSQERDWALENVMKEGPLRAGEFLSLGDFSSMLESARTNGDTHKRDRQQEQTLAERTREFEVRVTAMFSAFDKPIGATRRFSVVMEDNDEVLLKPTSPLTVQLSSWRQRRRVYRWLQNNQNRNRRELQQADDVG